MTIAAFGRRHRLLDDGDDPRSTMAHDDMPPTTLGDEFAGDELNDEFTDEIADDVTEDIALMVSPTTTISGEWADGNGSTGLHDAESVDQLNDWNSSVDQTREIDPITEPVTANVAAAAAAPTESTLDRLDDLQPQISAQPVADSVATSGDLDIANFDPTETIDIEPNDINLDSDPYYGSPDATTTIDTDAACSGSGRLPGPRCPDP